jgi:hypothetical protein
MADPKTTPQRSFLFCYFAGGWDTLLCLDPRDPGAFPESKIRDTKIQLGWDRLQAPFKPEVIQPSGSNLTFGPAMADFARHYDKSCIIRGMTAGTLAHETGRRFFITGLEPRGLSANGSSVPTEIVAQQGPKSPIPNLVIGLESYNRGRPAFATGLGVSGVNDLLSTLRDGSDAPDKNLRPLLDAWRAEQHSCDPTEMNRQGFLSLVTTMQEKARLLVTGDLTRYFNFNGGDAEMRALRDRYRIQGESSGAAQAATAFQAIRYNVAQCVSIVLSGGLDTHGEEWATNQPQRLAGGFQALGTLVDDLAKTPHSTYPGTLLDHTTIVVFSEFGRTPLLNTTNGRDHALSTCALLIGAGVPKNTVIGASSDVGMNPMSMNPITGKPEDGGIIVTPTHIMASIMKNAKYDITHFRMDGLPCLAA